jgi:hypothetical protein
MRKVVAVIFKFIAFLFAALTALGTIFVLLFLSFNRILLIPQTYEQAFTENRVYERLPVITAEEFSLVKSRLVEPCSEPLNGHSCLDQTVLTSPTDSTATNGLGTEGKAFINGLNQDQWKSLIIYLVTPNDLKVSTEATINEIIAYFKGQTDTVKMPLMNLKARLISMKDDDLITLLLKTQPVCSLEQQTAIMSGGLGEAGSPPILCSATGGTSQVLVLDLQRRLSTIAAELPDHATIILEPSPSNAPSLQPFLGKDLRATLQKINANSKNLPLLPFTLLLLVAVFGVRSLRGLLRWWGIPVFIAGLITLIFSIVIFFMFNWMWLNYISTSLPPLLTSGFGDLIYDVTHSLAKNFSKRLMLEAGIVTLLAFGVILISNRVPPPPDPSLPPLAQPGTPGGPVLNPQKKKRGW